MSSTPPETTPASTSSPARRMAFFVAAPVSALVVFWFAAAFLPACFSNPTPHPGAGIPPAGLGDARDQAVGENDAEDPGNLDNSPCAPQDVYGDATTDANADASSDAAGDADIGPSPGIDCGAPALDDSPDDEGASP